MRTFILQNATCLASFIKFLFSFGHSFACFLTPGMNIRLVAEANDYVGKVRLPVSIPIFTLPLLYHIFAIKL